jgi:hypothetical protein
MVAKLWHGVRRNYTFVNRTPKDKKTTDWFDRPSVRPVTSLAAFHCCKKHCCREIEEDIIEDKREMMLKSCRDRHSSQWASTMSWLEQALTDCSVRYTSVASGESRLRFAYRVNDEAVCQKAFAAIYGFDISAVKKALARVRQRDLKRTQFLYFFVP